MIRRKKDKIVHYKKILSTNNEEIGEIFLVSYFTQEKIEKWFIEFKIYDEYSHYLNKGIMTKALADYLKYCKKYDKNCLIATVKKDNIASKRVLEKNGFIKFKEQDNFDVYLIDLRLNQELAKLYMVNFFKQNNI